MSRFLRKRSKRKGLPPGSLVYVGKPNKDPLTITVINYNKESFEEKTIDDLEEYLSTAGDRATTTWIHITGLADKDTMKEIGESFGIHALWLEDVLNTDHRPKVEELDNLMFMIMKIPSLGKDQENRVAFEQISIFLGVNFVISFQESGADTFSNIKERIKKSLGNIRSSKADYLFYALTDRVVDDYYEIVEKLGARVEALDHELRDSFKDFDPDQIILLRNEFLYLRKSAVPIRDALKSLLASKVSEIENKNKRYFRDIYDHAIHIVEAIDGYRELLKGQVDSYQNALNLRTNETIKVLTIIASVFTPLTFIAGIYGMNFQRMPELRWDYGYYYSLGLMALVAGGLLFYFRRKDWI